MSQSEAETQSADASCAYVRVDGTRSPGQIEGDGNLCFWHDPDASKEEDGMRSRLEDWAATGESMEGFILRFAQLQGVKLTSHEGRVLRGRICLAQTWPGRTCGMPSCRAQIC